MLTNQQIEQFIESIFPSQGPHIIVGEKIDEPTNIALSVDTASKKKAEDQEARRDVMYMAAAVGLTLTLIAVMMVSKHRLRCEGCSFAYLL